MKQLKCAPADASSRATILLGLPLLIGAVVWMDYNFCVKAVPNQGWGVIIAPAIISVGLLIWCICALPMLRRVLLKYCIDKTGIRCSGIGWKPFEIKWEEIQTFGVEYYAFANRKMCVVYFWKTTEMLPSIDRHSYDYVNKIVPLVTRISKQHISIQMRNDLPLRLLELVPKDIQKYLKEALEKKKNVCIRR